MGRTKKKQKSLVIDFIDDTEKYFNEHSLSRIRVYEKQIGIKNMEVLDVDDEEFISDLENYLQDWFEK